MKIEHCGFKLVDVDYDNRLIILEKNDKPNGFDSHLSFGVM